MPRYVRTLLQRDSCDVHRLRVHLLRRGLYPPETKILFVAINLAISDVTEEMKSVFMYER